MFENTKVEEKYASKLKNIYKKHYEKCNISTKSLSKILDLDSFFINQYPDWYLIDNKLYYYKDYFIFNELFLSELIKEFNLKSVKYKLVKNGRMIGIVSKSFRDNESKYSDYNIYFHRKGIKVPRRLVDLDNELSKLLEEKNKIEIMNMFYRLTAFDIFVGQSDRSDANIVFKENDKTTLAPIFDNEFSFEDKYEYSSSFDKLYMPEKLYKGIIDNYNVYFFNLINNNKELFKYLTKSLDIDINEALNRTIEKYHLLIPLSDRNKLINFIDKRKKRIEYTLKLSQK